MGVDLTLMPILMRGGWLCHEMIQAPRDRNLMDEVSTLAVAPVDDLVHCFRAQHPDTGDTCYGPVEKDPYGRFLTWTPAASLALAFATSTDWKAKAIRAMLAEMPEDWPIVLYWH